MDLLSVCAQVIDSSSSLFVLNKLPRFLHVVMNEKMVYVWTVGGAIRTLCEVENTPDADTKIFRVKEWPKIPRVCDCGKVHSGTDRWSGQRQDGTPDGQVRGFSVFDSDNSVDYRVTAKLDTPDRYVAAYEVTTKPEHKPVDVPAVNDAQAPDAGRMLKIEDTIMCVLERETRITLRSLKRKTHAERFGADWDTCLQSLADGGELQIEQDPQVPQRTWIALSPASVTSDTNQSGDNLKQ